MADKPVTEISAKAQTPAEVAKELNVDAKTLRRIMRSMTDQENQPGSGARWEISADFKAVLAERVSRSHNRKTVAFVPKAAESK